jgi:multidrug transporter EmrE-like cation transporter
MTKTPLSSVALVLFASLLGSFGAVFLKLGAEKLRYGFRHVISWPAASGVGCYLLSSVFFVAGVRKGELSVLYPMVALGYVWTLIWSKLLFGEPLTRQKFVALGLILFGISLIGIGAH